MLDNMYPTKFLDIQYILVRILYLFYFINDPGGVQYIHDEKWNFILIILLITGNNKFLIKPLKLERRRICKP